MSSLITVIHQKKNVLGQNGQLTNKLPSSWNKLSNHTAVDRLSFLLRGRILLHLLPQKDLVTIPYWGSTGGSWGKRRRMKGTISFERRDMLWRSGPVVVLASHASYRPLTGLACLSVICFFLILVLETLALTLAILFVIIWKHRIKIFIWSHYNVQIMQIDSMLQEREETIWCFACCSFAALDMRFGKMK